MSNYYVRAFYERKEEPEPDGSPMRFTASTEGVARDGVVIQAEGWKLENYRKNPVVLWAHDYLGRNLPIGKAVNVSVDGKRLVAEVVFDQADEFARQVERKYRSGFLNAVSVGWETRQVEPGKGGGANKVTEAELLDISAVPVPGDPDALYERAYRAMKEMFGTRINTEDTDHTLDNTPEDKGAEGEWDELRAEMARVFTPAPDESTESRLRRYSALLPKYRRLGKTPPEFRSNEELEGLGEEEIAGLFFHDEFDTEMWRHGERVGAVLNTRNRDDLQQAVNLILGVLERAVAEKSATEEAETTDSTNALDEMDVLYARALLLKSYTNFSGGLK